MPSHKFSFGLLTVVSFMASPRKIVLKLNNIRQLILFTLFHLHLICDLQRYLDHLFLWNKVLWLYLIGNLAVPFFPRVFEFAPCFMSAEALHYSQAPTKSSVKQPNTKVNKDLLDTSSTLRCISSKSISSCYSAAGKPGSSLMSHSQNFPVFLPTHSSATDFEYRKKPSTLKYDQELDTHDY